MRYIIFLIAVSLVPYLHSKKAKSTCSYNDRYIFLQDTSSFHYSWLKIYNQQNTACARIKVPAGYQRVPLIKGSFGYWLRYVPLKEKEEKVHLYNGELKADQSVHYAVIDMDVGDKDLQQCADAVMRLRAEYFFSKGEFKKLHFNYTSGDKVFFEDWCRGRQPVVKAGKVSFIQTKPCKPAYAQFRKYLDNIFNYCGTVSLCKEMKPVQLKAIEPGDVFIFGGMPGHAMLVMDAAVNNITGEKIFLLAQSYMPAQEMHIVKNPSDSGLSPWYAVNAVSDKLITPEWTFSKDELKRFESD